jgi:hypothetical protein
MHCREDGRLTGETGQQQQYQHELMGCYMDKEISDGTSVGNLEQ